METTFRLEIMEVWKGKIMIVDRVGDYLTIELARKAKEEYTKHLPDDIFRITKITRETIE